MIFGASLGPFVKKALEDKAFQTNVGKIVETMPLAPEATNMDAVVLGPKDMRGAAGAAITEAMRGKHPSVRIIYLYMKDKERDLISEDATKIKVDKLTPQAIKEAVATVFDLNEIGSDGRILESADAKARAREALELRAAPPAAAEPVEAEVAAAAEEALPVEADESNEPERELPKSLEQKLLEMGQFADFHFFKQALSRDEVLSDLLRQNTQYAELVKVLEALDLRIAHIFKDTTLTVEERFEFVKQVGMERATYSGLENQMLADKFGSVMDAIVQSAEATVDARIERIREALGVVSSVKLLYHDQARLDELIEKRLGMQAELMELSKDIIEVYMAMDRSITDLVTQMDDELPYNNEYLNEAMKPIRAMFIPQNIATVTSRLLGDLQRNRVTLSIMEEKIKKLITLVFRLCEEDATIIDYQQRLIKLLRAQRIEEVVVVDNLIKHSLRLFVGAPETGRTATALTWSGALARRQNVLLLDLTGKSKFGQYGMETVSLDNLLANRLERPLLCAEGCLDDDPERVDDVVAELKTRLNYYAYLNVLIDSSQTELLERLAASALSVHFVADCSPRGTEMMKRTMEAFREPNIARKVVLIDPPIEPLRMLDELGADPLLTKLIVLPRMQHIRVCSLRRQRPFDSREVVEVFEEAFR
ncbi:hypothetical protein ACF3MZ_07240 [Paenibacillaceae bacterium WGS1546]|uniref:hypothetical protein n=1 Tax=Cohnella sp. WGS1546 TaxID=3366810 RepID=UPI00372D761D